MDTTSLMDLTHTTLSIEYGQTQAAHALMIVHDMATINYSSPKLTTEGFLE